MSSQRATFILGFLSGCFGWYVLCVLIVVSYVVCFDSAALFAFARSQKALKKYMFRLCGADEKVEKMLKDAKQKEKRRMTSLSKYVSETLASSLSTYSAERQKQMLLIKSIALAILNMDPDPSSRNFTFWQRRTKTIQSDIEGLRERLKNGGTMTKPTMNKTNTTPIMRK